MFEFKSYTEELETKQVWLAEYFANRHKTWALRRGLERTPEGKRYCRDSMFSLIRRNISEIRELRKKVRAAEIGEDQFLDDCGDVWRIYV